jgi:N-acyl-D-amino-acid deacylase
LQLADRGVLRAGNVADLVVFDAGQIASPATYEEPNVEPLGVLHVIKNGVIQ